MFKYAQLEENGIVVGISFLSGIVEAPNMVLLDGSRTDDESVGLFWRYVGGEWFPPFEDEQDDGGETA